MCLRMPLPLLMYLGWLSVTLRGPAVHWRVGVSALHALQGWAPSALFIRAPQAASPVASQPVAVQSLQQQQQQPQQRVFSGPYGLQDSESDTEDATETAAPASTLQVPSCMAVQCSVSACHSSAAVRRPVALSTAFACTSSCCLHFTSSPQCLTLSDHLLCMMPASDVDHCPPIGLHLVQPK